LAGLSSFGDSYFFFFVAFFFAGAFFVAIFVFTSDPCSLYYYCSPSFRVSCCLKIFLRHVTEKFKTKIKVGAVFYSIMNPITSQFLKLTRAPFRIEVE
jgi:multisubunit Na+/H+ antiporter MnhG subunit